MNQVLPRNKRRRTLSHGAGNRLATRQGCVEALGEADGGRHRNGELHGHHGRHTGTNQARSKPGEQRVARYDASLAGGEEHQPHLAVEQQVLHVFRADEISLPRAILEGQVALG